MCPGVYGRHCGRFIESAIKDPYPSYIFCCGKVCEYASLGSICAAWDSAQWDQYERVKLAAACKSL